MGVGGRRCQDPAAIALAAPSFHWLPLPPSFALAGLAAVVAGVDAVVALVPVALAPTARVITVVLAFPPSAGHMVMRPAGRGVRSAAPTRWAGSTASIDSPPEDRRLRSVSAPKQPGSVAPGQAVARSTRKRSHERSQLVNSNPNSSACQ